MRDNQNCKNSDVGINFQTGFDFANWSINEIWFGKFGV